MKLISAEQEHIEELVKYSILAFDSDVNVGADSAGGPPEYDSIDWHVDMMRSGHLYTAMDGDTIVGGALLFDDERNKHVLYIGRIFVNPALFRQGYGMAIMKQIEELDPKYTIFYLDTPIWNIRTNQFYMKLRYVENRRDSEFVYYQKQLVKEVYSNTNAHLYDDLALWERTNGVDFMKEMPLNNNMQPKVLDIGIGFAHYTFAAANAFPEGTIYGIEGNDVCISEVTKLIQERGIQNIKMITETVDDLSILEDNTFDLVLIYDTLHASYKKMNMFLSESHRILKPGGCLSALPFHLGNFRDKDENKKRFSIAKIKSVIEDYGFDYAGTCREKGYTGRNVILFTIYRKVRSHMMH